MEVYDQQTGLLQVNSTWNSSTFSVSGLDAGRLLTIVIYAANFRGRSEKVFVEAFTLKAAEKQMGLYKYVYFNQFEKYF